MINSVKNPFTISGYVSAKYFCDRVEETKELIGAFVNGRNVVLISPRRMGKTGDTPLLHPAADKIDTTLSLSTFTPPFRGVYPKACAHASQFGANSSPHTARERVYHERKLYDRFFGLWLSQEYGIGYTL